MRKFITPLLTLPCAVYAQSGHTLPWRLSEVVGFIAFAVLAGMVIWHLRR